MLLACNNKYYLMCDKITNFRIFTKLIPIRHFVHPCRLQVQGEFVYILSAQSKQRTCKQTRLDLQPTSPDKMPGENAPEKI